MIKIFGRKFGRKTIMMNKIGFIAVVISICCNLCAGVLYRTSFEAQDEPFGDWKTDKGRGPGKVTSERYATGSNSRMTGPGLGQYGQFFSIPLKETLQDAQIFVSFRYFSEKSGSYAGFFQLKGKSDGEPQLIAYTILGSGAVNARNPDITKNLTPGALIGRWVTFTYRLDFKKQVYSLEVDGKSVIGDTAFFAMNAKKKRIESLDEIVFGGTSAADGNTFIDDLIVSSDPIVPEKGAVPTAFSRSRDFRPQSPLATVGRAQSAPTVDGVLDDAVWQKAVELGGFVDGAGNRRELQPTRILLAYDDQHLYLAAEGIEPKLDPALNQRPLFRTGGKEHGKPVWLDESIELFIAPDAQKPQNYYHLAMNLAGGTFCLVPEGKKGAAVDFVAVSVLGDRSWTLEAAIPLEKLGIPAPSAGTSWKFNCCRNRLIEKEISSWARNFGSNHNYNAFGTLTFAQSAPEISLSIPDYELRGGENELKLSSDGNPSREFEVIRLITYGDQDTEVQRSTIVGSAKSVPIFFNLNVPGRNSISQAAVSAEIRDRTTGAVLQRTTPVFAMRKQYSPLKSSLVATTSNVIFHPINRIYINRGTVRPTLFAAQLDPKLRTETSRCSAVFDLPESLEIMPGNALKMDSRPYRRADGQNRREVRLELPAENLFTLAPLGPEQPYNTWTLLVFKAAPDALLKDAEARFYLELRDGNKVIREADNMLPVTILDGLKNTPVPKSFPLIFCTGPHHRMLKNMTQEQRRAFFETVKASGCNYMGVDRHHISAEIETELRETGFFLYYDIPLNVPATWQPTHFPDAADFLREHPDFRAVDASGKIYDDVICANIVTAADSPYRERLHRWIAEYAMPADALLWDYEVPPAGSKATCLCDRCLADFADKEKIAKPTREEALKNHREAWIDYQSRRVATMAAELRRVVKAVKPDCEFWIYSGYQSDATRRNYSVDWSLLPDSLDRAVCGYGRNPALTEATARAAAPKPVIHGMLMQLWWNTFFNYDQLEVNIFRRLTDASGGVLFWSDMQTDGRFFAQTARVSRLVESHRELFLNPERKDGMARWNGKIDDRIAVLVSKDGRSGLVLIFNSSAESLQGKLSFDGNPKSVTVRDFDDRKDLALPGDLVVRPFSVRIIEWAQ